MSCHLKHTVEVSSSRAGISRYELGVHEPPLPTTRLIAHALGVPLSYLYCEDDKVAALLMALRKMKPFTGLRATTRLNCNNNSGGSEP